MKEHSQKQSWGCEATLSRCAETAGKPRLTLPFAEIKSSTPRSSGEKACCVRIIELAVWVSTRFLTSSSRPLLVHKHLRARRFSHVTPRSLGSRLGSCEQCRLSQCMETRCVVARRLCLWCPHVERGCRKGQSPEARGSSRYEQQQVRCGAVRSVVE